MKQNRTTNLLILISVLLLFLTPVIAQMRAYNSRNYITSNRILNNEEFSYEQNRTIINEKLPKVQVKKIYKPYDKITSKSVYKMIFFSIFMFLILTACAIFIRKKIEAYNKYKQEQKQKDLKNILNLLKEDRNKNRDKNREKKPSQLQDAFNEQKQQNALNQQSDQKSISLRDMSDFSSHSKQVQKDFINNQDESQDFVNEISPLKSIKTGEISIDFNKSNQKRLYVNNIDHMEIQEEEQKEFEVVKRPSAEFEIKKNTEIRHSSQHHKQRNEIELQQLGIEKDLPRKSLDNDNPQAEQTELKYLSNPDILKSLKKSQSIVFSQTNLSQVKENNIEESQPNQPLPQQNLETNEMNQLLNKHLGYNSNVQMEEEKALHQSKEQLKRLSLVKSAVSQDYESPRFPKIQQEDNVQQPINEQNIVTLTESQFVQIHPNYGFQQPEQQLQESNQQPEYYEQRRRLTMSQQVQPVQTDEFKQYLQQQEQKQKFLSQTQYMQPQQKEPLQQNSQYIPLNPEITKFEQSGFQKTGSYQDFDPGFQSYYNQQPQIGQQQYEMPSEVLQDPLSKVLEKYYKSFNNYQNLKKEIQQSQYMQNVIEVPMQQFTKQILQDQGYRHYQPMAPQQKINHQQINPQLQRQSFPNQIAKKYQYEKQFPQSQYMQPITEEPFEQHQNQIPIKEANSQIYLPEQDPNSPYKREINNAQIYNEIEGPVNFQAKYQPEHVFSQRIVQGNKQQKGTYNAQQQLLRSLPNQKAQNNYQRKQFSQSQYMQPITEEPLQQDSQYIPLNQEVTQFYQAEKDNYIPQKQPQESQLQYFQQNPNIEQMRHTNQEIKQIPLNQNPRVLYQSMQPTKQQQFEGVNRNYGFSSSLNHI